MVKQKCPLYYAIFDIMNYCASTKPKATSYDLDDSTADIDEDGDWGDKFISVSNQAGRELGNIDVQQGASVCGVSNISVIDGYAQGTPTSSQAKRIKKTPSLEEEGIIVLDQASKRSAERMVEMTRHHKMIESMESRKVELQMQQNESKLQLEQKKEEREEI